MAKKVNLRQRLLKDIVRESLAAINSDSNELTNAEIIYGEILTLKALNGDLKAIDMLTKLSGEDEPQKIDINANATVGLSHQEAVDLIKKNLK